ncbi:hypothetical protein BN874_1230037 [Candidatus Contendobacter odensis Run_B_J11]|uniref:Uncharacterized protein n=1 Tax=Candidatus Contendobacter odensis Run_B_J11 TaxID=1400861 RepID=A0A7U7G7T5_9GAMM|nr:hypothetical protein BN874_1230037 [Candidatus Contendobacter odensis Run_B_J11]
MIFGQKISERRLVQFYWPPPETDHAHYRERRRGWSGDIRSPHYISGGSFLLDFIQFRSRRDQGSRDFVLTEDETITVLEPDHFASTDALFGIVQVDPVGTGVGEEVAAILMMDGAMLTRQDAFRVLQDPVALRGATDADGTTVEYLGSFLARRESLVAGDSQFQGHDAVSVGRGAASTAPSGIHRNGSHGLLLFSLYRPCNCAKPDYT